MSSIRTSRRGAIVAGVVGTALSLWLALAADSTESSRHEQLFTLWANERTQVLTARFESIVGDVPTFRSFFENSEVVTHDEFDQFARDWIARHIGTVRIAWVPMSDAGAPAATFVEPAEQGDLANALLARPEFLAALASTRASGALAATSPMTERASNTKPSPSIAVGRDDASGDVNDERVVVHLITPIDAGDPPGASGDSRRGHVVVTLLPTATIASALSRTTPVGLDIAVADIEDGKDPIPVAVRRSNAPRATVDPPSRDTDAGSGLRHSTSFDVADRSWQVVVDATPYFDRLRRAWLAPAVFAGGALLTGLLALHLASLSARARLVEELVLRRTAQLERANSELDEHRGLLERRVAERTQQLADANHELEAFSYSVSHDLRAPLRAIDGFSGLLLAKTETIERLDGEFVRRLGVIRRNVQHMGRLIDDLLAFSKLSRVELVRREVDMNALVHSCLDTLEQERAGRNVVIHVHDLPPCFGDESLLREVWLNLLSNALKYTRHVASAHVDVSAERVDGRTEYVVADDGVGFDMRYAHKLFGVFQRLHRAEDYPGTGVGLALVQRIVHRHGGAVTATAEPGKGATFRFTIDEVGHG